MAATKKRPPGRPVDLDRVIRPADDDRDAVTVADRIVLAVAAGNDVRIAAASAGIAKSTLMDYLRTGARTNIALNAGAVRGDFTPKELACAEFSDRVTRAQADFEINTHLVVDRVIRGGIPIEEVTTRYELRDVDGTERLIEVERKVRATESLPDARVALERLRMRHPDRYAKNRIEVHDGHAPDVEVPLDSEALADAALRSLRQWKAQAIEAGSDPVDD